MTGTVKWFNDDKGFITPTGATRREEDVFVHVRALKRSIPPIRELHTGDRVQFDPAPGKPRKRAINIVVIQSAAPIPLT